MVEAPWGLGGRLGDGSEARGAIGPASGSKYVALGLGFRVLGRVSECDIDGFNTPHKTLRQRSMP